MEENNHPKPDKTIVYIFMAVAMGGLAFFVYNWWKCKQSRVIHEEYEGDGAEFQGANIYHKDL